jgi:hypothetical protein
LSFVVALRPAALQIPAMPEQPWMKPFRVIFRLLAFAVVVWMLFYVLDTYELIVIRR